MSTSISYQLQVFNKETQNLIAVIQLHAMKPERVNTSKVYDSLSTLNTQNKFTGDVILCGEDVIAWLQTDRHYQQLRDIHMLVQYGGSPNGELEMGTLMIQNKLYKVVHVLSLGKNIILV